jgi:hypothetical protein
MLNKSIGGEAKRKLCFSNWRQPARYGRAAGAGPAHLFGLAGGSIPPASCGWMPFRFGKYNFFGWVLQLSQLQWTFWVAPGVFLFPGHKNFFLLEY